MSKEAKAIEFKAGSLTVMNVILRDLKHETISHALNSLFGGAGENFDNDAAVLDLGQLINVPERMEWNTLTALLRRYGLQVAALKNTPDPLIESARVAGLVLLPKVAARAGTEGPPQSSTARQSGERIQGDLDFQPAKESAEPVATRQESTPTKVIDRMVRSGQQIYARGGDLILLNGVSPGAEVIADGSIHCYGPLRGRAIAGAQGTTSARIFSSNFGPELISIAGIYRNFDSGIPEKVASRAAQALLKANPVLKDQNKPETSGEQFALHLEPIQLN